MNTIKTVLFTDIDDTLMQTERKCDQWLSNQDISVDDVWAIGAVDKVGKPLSYVMPAQQQLLQQFSHSEIIPVTGRNKAALDRVDLPFTSYQVVDHGAIVLGFDGQLDEQWQMWLQPQVKAWGDSLTFYQQTVANWIDKGIDGEALSLRSRVIEDFSIPCYVSIKGEELALKKVAAKLQELPQWRSEMRIHINGHNMALLPPYACKRTAVMFLQKRFRDQHSEVLFWAAGDSTSDLPFMAECHFQIIPPTSQIQHDCLAPAMSELLTDNHCLKIEHEASE